MAINCLKSFPIVKRKEKIMLYFIRSKTFENTDKTDTGLWLIIVLQSPLLYIGITLAIFNSFWNTPCESDKMIK